MGGAALFFLSGCPEESAGEAPGVSVGPSGRAEAQAAPEEAGETVEEGQVLDPEEAERAELEAACFEGSQEACDQLGH